MYAEYKHVRGSIGLDKKSLLPINATSSDQVCHSFGIHEKLPFIKDLYDQKDLAFLAGIGVMSAPVNKHNYESVTKTQLFAHNKGNFLFLHSSFCSLQQSTYFSNIVLYAFSPSRNQST